MRRFLSSAAKAVHRDKKQNVPIRKDLNKLNLTIGPAPADGHVCWDQTKCGLCSNFLHPWFVLRLFTSGSVLCGTLVDLITWSQAGNGCPLCKYIICWFFHEIGTTIPFEADVYVKWDITAVPGANGERKIQFTSIEFDMMWETRQVLSKSANFNCHTDAGQDMACYLPTRPANPYVGSEAAFSHAKSWIHTCVNSHLRCQQISPGSSELPTRVIEVSKEANGTYSIRLRKGEGRRAPYIALSYVWGGPQTCQTLLSNIDEHVVRIDVTKLPLTIMDAVHCTFALGCKYLWVDSLCIIQDSLVDKVLEIDRMSRIYKNSYVTISAANAVRCEEGFLGPRADRADLFKCSFGIETITPKDSGALFEWVEKYGLRYERLEFLTNGEKIFEASNWRNPDSWCKSPSKFWIALVPLDRGDQDDLLTAHDIQTEPINKRGWTLQESWLSPRILIYGSKQMLWRCRGGIQADGGVTGYENKEDIRDTYQIDQNGQMVHLDGTKVLGDEKQSIFHRMWEDLVRESSARELGSPADKLNALEGIVQELRNSTGDVYLAGLWRSNLVNQLCWYQDARESDAKLLVWSNDRVCPSWSWVKTDGYVAFDAAESSEVVIEEAKITRNEITGAYPETRLHVEGSIRLRAPVITATPSHLAHFIFPAPGEICPPHINIIHPDGGFSNSEIQMVTTNGEQQIELPQDLRFLELTYGRTHLHPLRKSKGLAIVPADVEGQTNVYIRIGFYSVMLEEEIKPTGLVYSASRLRGKDWESNLRDTELGKMWKSGLKEEKVVLL